jgi:hypothetical protein
MLLRQVGKVVTNYGDGSGEREARIAKAINDTGSCCAPETSRATSSAA